MIGLCWLVTLVDNAEAKQIGFVAAAKINAARAASTVDDAKLTLATVRTEITNSQKRKSAILKNLDELSKRGGGRRYTREMHRLDQITLYLKELGEDRKTARYLLDRARLARRKCEEVLESVLND